MFRNTLLCIREMEGESEISIIATSNTGHEKRLFNPT
jgi:hypothetical protein